MSTIGVYRIHLYIERKTDDPIRNRTINETKVWAKVLAKEHTAMRLVNPVFRLLGAKEEQRILLILKSLLYLVMIVKNDCR